MQKGTPQRPPHRILVVEDDRDIAHLIELHLRDEGYAVTLARDGAAGLETALARPFDLILLDLMLPELEGLEVCRRLRAGGGSAAGYTPILMLTSRSSELDRVLGLEMGADDYLTKPFGIRELLARVRAILRRVEALRAPEDRGEPAAIRVGDLLIEPQKRRVTLGGAPVSLTAKEFDLLVHFAAHPGRVYTRTNLLDAVWGHGYEGYEHTVNSHINRLRTKIERDPARPRFLLTIWGVGYKFADPDESAETDSSGNG